MCKKVYLCGKKQKFQMVKRIKFVLMSKILKMVLCVSFWIACQNTAFSGCMETEYDRIKGTARRVLAEEPRVWDKVLIGTYLKDMSQQQKEEHLAGAIKKIPEMIYWSIVCNRNVRTMCKDNQVLEIVCSWLTSVPFRNFDMRGHIHERVYFCYDVIKELDDHYESYADNPLAFMQQLARLSTIISKRVDGDWSTACDNDEGWSNARKSFVNILSSIPSGERERFVEDIISISLPIPSDTVVYYAEASVRLSAFSDDGYLIPKKDREYIFDAFRKFREFVGGDYGSCEQNDYVVSIFKSDPSLWPNERIRHREGSARYIREKVDFVLWMIEQGKLSTEANGFNTVRSALVAYDILREACEKINNFYKLENDFNGLELYATGNNLVLFHPERGRTSVLTLDPYLVETNDFFGLFPVQEFSEWRSSRNLP